MTLKHEKPPATGWPVEDWILQKVIVMCNRLVNHTNLPDTEKHNDLVKINELVKYALSLHTGRIIVKLWWAEHSDPKFARTADKLKSQVG